jgi:hypothetical protein
MELWRTGGCRLARTQNAFKDKASQALRYVGNNKLLAKGSQSGTRRLPLTPVGGNDVFQTSWGAERTLNQRAAMRYVPRGRISSHFRVTKRIEHWTALNDC